MPRREFSKEFFSRLSDTDRVRFRLDINSGELLEFTVQYETLIDDNWYPVVRYDSAHGHGHRDILDQTGQPIEKFWLPPTFSHKDSAAYAQNDLREHWQQYRDEFLEGFQS
jgi:hypothetical protein